MRHLPRTTAKKRNVRNTGELLATVKGWNPDTLRDGAFKIISASATYHRQSLFVCEPVIP